MPQSESPRQIVAIATIFQRTENSSWEPGVFIGRSEDDQEGFIVGMDGQPAEVYNYEDKPHCGVAIFREDA